MEFTNKRPMNLKYLLDLKTTYEMMEKSLVKNFIIDAQPIQF